MTRHQTLSELLAPDDTIDAALPVEWASGATAQILRWVWLAFDALHARLPQVSFSQPLEQLERDLVRLHYLDIQEVWTRDTQGYSSIRPQHEWPEMESRKPPPAMPPSYDLAFVDSTHIRWVWPLEAKVLSTPHALSEYMGDINNKFIPGVAAPLCGEGGMIGYLLSGQADEVFTRLEERYQLKFDLALTGRPQRSSQHSRSTAPKLRLHHLVMSVSSQN